MTIRFRLTTVELDTTNGRVTHNFTSDLSVLAGPTGVGKTSLFELIKFALGGDGQLAPVAKQDVTHVHVALEIGAERFRLSRALRDDLRGTVRVYDLITQERLADHAVSMDEEPSISTLLLTALGLQSGLRAASRGGRSSNAGTRISFNDVFTFLYVRQADINRDIAKSSDAYYNPKRIAVFELLFGLTDAAILGMRSEINVLRKRIEAADKEYATVQDFLATTGGTSRFDTEIALAEATSTFSNSSGLLASLQDELSPASDVETQTLRDLLNASERDLADAERSAIELDREHREYEAERNRIDADRNRLARMADAGLRLANIEFAICPRCTQRLDIRPVDEGDCPVCLLPDVVQPTTDDEQYESLQLGVQRDEISDQIAAIEGRKVEVERAIRDRLALVSSLAVQIDERTAGRVSPRLQAYADATAAIERARVQIEFLEVALLQWDRVEDLGQRAEDLKSQRDRLRREADAADAHLAQRKRRLITELSEEFNATAMDFHIPSVETASISETYLPLLNGQPFQEVSLGGGIITATQVAYWLSVVTIASRWADTNVPGFLMIDSPRLALNNQKLVTDQMYRRFDRQVGARPGSLQFIVADNELPGPYAKGFQQIDFDYDSPTVASIDHPGPGGVETLTPDLDGS